MPSTAKMTIPTTPFICGRSTSAPRIPSGGNTLFNTWLPDYDWPRLRKEFPEEFENPVDSSLVPTDWVPLRVVVKGRTIQVYVGPVKSATLEVRQLGRYDRGMIGLWTGNNSDGDFANLRITSMK